MSDENKPVIFATTQQVAKFNYADAQKQIERQNNALAEMGDTSIITITLYNGYINVHIRASNKVHPDDVDTLRFLKQKIIEAIRERELHKVTKIVDI